MKLNQKESLAAGAAMGAQLQTDVNIIDENQIIQLEEQYTK